MSSHRFDSALSNVATARTLPISTPTPTLTPATTPTPTVTPVSTPIETPTPTPSSTPSPIPTPTATPTPTPTSTPIPTATPTPTPVQTPAAPTNLLATAISSSQIALSWTDNSTNENGFRIQRSSDGITFVLIATVGIDVTTYTDDGLMAVTTYYYRARAYNSDGNSALSNVGSATTLPASTSSQIALSWTDNSTNENGFRIQRTSAV